MLNILTSQGLSNVLVIVTRYFGGILLGTGGLVRAYSDATTKAIEKSKIVIKDLGLEAELEVNYADLQKLKYYCEQKNINITNQEFHENVTVIFDITQENFEFLKKYPERLNFTFTGLKKIKDKYICVL